MFSNPFNNAFGLDINDQIIRLVQLKNQTNYYGQFEIVNVRSINLPSGLIQNGELIKPEDLRHYILKLLKANKHKKLKSIKGNWVVASLPENKTFLKIIRLNKDLDEILDTDIINEAEKHLPFENIDDYYLDWQIIKTLPQEKQTIILLGASDKTTANTYTFLLESINLSVKALDLKPLAISRTFNFDKKNLDKDILVLNLNNKQSSLFILNSDYLQFSSTINFQGQKIDAILSSKLNLKTPNQIKKFKIKNSLNFKHNSKDIKKVWVPIHKELKKLIDEINQNIQFYYSHFTDAQAIAKILISGEEIILKDLDKYIQTNLKINTKIVNPWQKLYNKKPIPIDIYDSPGYACAIGLALRAVDNPFSKKDII